MEEVKSMGGMIGPVSHWSHFVMTRWQTVCCPPLGLQWMASVDFGTM